MTITRSPVQTPRVNVDGAEVPPDVVARLVEAYVDDSLDLPAVLVLRFTDLSDSEQESGGFRVGAKVKVTVEDAQNQLKDLFDGEITTLELDLRETGKHTVVRAFDIAHRLTRGSRVRSFQRMTAADIVKTVAREAGIPLGLVHATSTVFEHLTQDGVSDWEFLRRLAQRSNRVIGVDAGKLTFRELPRAVPGSPPPGPSDRVPPPPTCGRNQLGPLALAYGSNLLRVRATVTAVGQVSGVQVRGWDPKQRRAVVAQARSATVAAAITDTPSGLAGKFEGATQFVAARPATNLSSACTEEAKALSERLSRGFVQVDGAAFGDPALRAGASVQLKGVGTTFEGAYVLTATRHDFTPDAGYITSFRASNTTEPTLYGAASGGGRVRGGGPAVGAVYPAIVTNSRDPENLGRVKVALPWLDDTYESDWARTVFPGANGKSGMISIPEVNDEVLVAFGDDDLTRPYVLGGLTSGPGAGSRKHVERDQTAVREWTSRTGMTIAMTEKTGESHMLISTPDGKQTIALNHLKSSGKGIEVVAQEGDVTVTAEQGHVTVTAQKGDVTVKGVNVTVEAQQDLKLSGTSVTVAARNELRLSGANATVAANAKLELSSTGTAKLSGSGPTELSTPAILTVRGSLVKIN